MAAIFWDGFDKYGPVGMSGTSASAFGAALLAEWNTVSGNGTFTAVAGRFGGQALQIAFGSSGTVTQLAKTLPSNAATLVFGVAFQGNLVGTPSIAVLDGSTSQLCVVINTAGKIEARSGTITGTLLGTSSASVSANSWHYLEGQVTVNNTTGSVTINLDGVQILNLTGQNTRGGTSNNYANALGFITGASAAGTVTIDDLYLFDTTGSANNAMRGDSRVETLFPAADTATKAFTVGAGVFGAYYSTTGSVAAYSANQLVLRRFAPLVNCTVNSVSFIPQSTSSAKQKPVIYADSGFAPSGAPLSSGAEVAGTTAGTTLTMALTTPQNLTGGTNYWIGYITDTSINVSLGDANNSGYTAVNTYASGPPTSPTMTGSKSSWQIWGNTSGQSTNYSELGSVPPPGDLSYVTASTTVEDLYTFGSLSSTPNTIAGVKIAAFSRKTDAGARTVDLRVKSGGTETGGSSTGQSPTASYTFLDSYWETDPNTSAAWTASAVNAVSAGFKIDT